MRTTTRILLLILCCGLTGNASATSRESYFSVEPGDVKLKAQMLNSWALDLRERGFALPAELMSVIGRAGNADQTSVSQLSNQLDGFANELILLEDSPQLLGKVTLSKLSSTFAGSLTSFSQTYTVAKRLTRGAGILVARHWQQGIEFQIDAPGRANYVSATTNNSSVELKLKQIPYQGIHGSLYGLSMLPYIEIIAGELVPGDKIIIHYGTRAAGIRLPKYSVASMTMPLFLKMPDNDHFFTVPVPALEVSAGPVAKLVLTAPSLLASGEDYSLVIRAEDKYGNLATGQIPTLDLLIDGQLAQRVNMPPGSLTRLDGLSFNEQGLHSISARSGGGGLKGIANPILVDNSLNTRIIWANLHQHSNQSIGLRSSEEIAREDTGRYDLSLITEQADYLSHNTGNDATIEISKPLANGGNHLRLANNLAVVLAENPTDRRLLTNPILAEILSGDSHYEWLGRYYADAGYRIGFAATPASHLKGKAETLAKTAIITGLNKNWREAIAARRTYVSTGTKAILLSKANTAKPGERVAASAKRIIAGEIIAAAPIDAIELVKNGKVIDQHRYSLAAGQSRFKISLGSASKPLYAGWEKPRNGREWLGFIKLNGLHIAALDKTAYQQRNYSDIAVNPGDSQRIDFISWTHGSNSSFVLSLLPETGTETGTETGSGAATNLSQEASIDINIAAGFEDVNITGNERKPSATAAAQFNIPISEIGREGTSRTINVNGYQDSITVTPVNAENPRRVKYAFMDHTGTGIGDYYYVRITLRNDQQLWSSPSYFGGYDVH